MTKAMPTWYSHIELTNHCPIGDCLYCSRYERHIPKEKLYHMTLAQVEEALYSYIGFPNKIGIIGGDPLVHPEFDKVCELLLKYGDKTRYGLWTSIDPKKSKWKDSIEKTFHYIAYNEHNPSQLKVCKHTPITLASIDMVPNKELRKELQSQCYFRNRWCSTINTNGAFHCEIAAALAYLFEEKGWPLTPEWWKRDWHDQQSLCDLCGGCIPQEGQLIGNKKQKISKTLLDLFSRFGYDPGDFELVEEPYSIEYLKEHAGTPVGAYRGDLGVSDAELWNVNIDWSKYEK